MAVGANTYGSVSGVERLVGDIVQDRDFSTSTVPTEAQVELILDDIAADLNRALLASGYSAPISTGDSISRTWITSINNYGAAAQVLVTIPTTAIAPGQEQAAGGRSQYYQTLFDRAISQIEEHKLSASRSRGRLGAIKSGSQSDTDGNRKLPSFKRSLTDFPSNISRTEE